MNCLVAVVNFGLCDGSAMHTRPKQLTLVSLLWDFNQGILDRTCDSGKMAEYIWMETLLAIVLKENKWREPAYGSVNIGDWGPDENWWGRQKWKEMVNVRQQKEV